MTSIEEFKQTKLQLHQAVQMLAATGISYLEKQPDDSHTNMEWRTEIQSFISNTFGEKERYRLALNVPQFEYRIYTEDFNLITEFQLDQKTEQQAIAWYINELGKLGFDKAGFTTDKHYEIPLTEQAKGKPYNLFNPDAFKIFSDHFSMAQKLISQNIAVENNSSPLRCWPHHFDLGALIPVEAKSSDGKTMSIGAGFSPGDENYNQPYYYVYPWPYPEKEILKDSELPGDSFWHHNGFVSAILEIDPGKDISHQQSTIQNFLNTSIKISKKILIS